MARWLLLVSDTGVVLLFPASIWTIGQESRAVVDGYLGNRAATTLLKVSHLGSSVKR
jgi:hypothetical protein